MLNIDARNVPGKKRDPRKARVFMEAPSFLVTSARRFCCAANIVLIVDSLKLTMLSICYAANHQRLLDDR